MGLTNDDLKLLRGVLGQTWQINAQDVTSRSPLDALVAKATDIKETFPAEGDAIVGHVRWVRGDLGVEMMPAPRIQPVIGLIKEKDDCGCGKKVDAPEVEAQLKCILKTVLQSSLETTGDVGACAVSEMLERAKRVSAQRKFLHGLYDVYVNAAIASGLPNELLPSAVGGRGGGQDGGDGGGRPSAP